MKSIQDPRHMRRAKIIQGLFQYSYTNNTEGFDQAQPIISKLESIDRIIKQAAPEWPLDKLNRVDLAILRLSIWELINQDNPEKVIIDEAIELAKEFGSDNSSKFINGALGAALQIIKPKSD